MRRAALVIAAFVLMVGLAVIVAAPLRAATPEPSVLVPGDPRSDGEGPGLVGSPIAVALGVVLLGVVTAGATLLVLRLTREE